MKQYYSYNLDELISVKLKIIKKIYRNIKLIKLYLNLNNFIYNNYKIFINLFN